MISGFILNGIILLSDDLLHQKRIRPTRLIRKSVSSIVLLMRRSGFIKYSISYRHPKSSLFFA
jgi:hypothetical protein